MNRTRPNVNRTLLGALVLATVTAVAACGTDDPGPPIERDLGAIAERDTLVALVTFNSTSYFIYRGRPMGLEYEILQQFADAHDLELRTRVVRDRDRVLHLLNEGAGDVAAARVVPTARDEPHVAYTRPIYRTRAALVQQTAPPESADLPAEADTLQTPRDSAVAPRDPIRIRARLVEDLDDLAGREVHTPERTFYEDRLVELSDSLGEPIEVVEVDSAAYETLIRQLSRGEIGLTVAPENLAELKASHFENIEVTPVIGPPHDVTLGVRRNAPRLLEALNAWVEEAEADGRLQQLYEKYFVDRTGFRERVASEYLTTETGQLSEYDDLLRQHAPAIGWDWRLLASQTFQESLFDPNARSWAGAMGLLQLMPATAREVGVSNPMDPEQNVAGAVRYLGWLTDQWRPEIEDPEQRLRFVLASYNAGFGHVSDARRLAEKNGDDPDSWEDVSYWLLQKTKRSVYKDPVVKYGYCRGLEPVMYVKRILERYDHYREFVRT